MSYHAEKRVNHTHQRPRRNQLGSLRLGVYGMYTGVKLRRLKWEAENGYGSEKRSRAL